MSDLAEIRRLVEAAAASLDASRTRIDDLNVYPVPDGDTGTNMSLTMHALGEALADAADAPRPALAHTVTRAALMGARGNSGVILSQIVRGAAEVLGEAETVDSRAVADALRSASDTAYRGVRQPVEGTILTVIREMAEEAEADAASELEVDDLLRAVLARGEVALARTQELLDVLREAGVVDAGGAGLVEIARGIVSAVTGDELKLSDEASELGLGAIHRELSEFRYCTAFLVEGSGLDAESLERELEVLGDSLLVVGDESALKIHVHTDDPGAALSLGTVRGAIAGVEIADMHVQTADRAERLTAAAVVSSDAVSDVVAVVAGSGNRRLYESLGVARIVEGGQSMNPSTADILEAIEVSTAPEVVVLPNNGNVIMSAEQAVALAGKPASIVPTRSIQAGLSALLAYDPAAAAEENAEAMSEAIGSVATAAVTIASRDVELNGLEIREGEYLGLLEDEPLVGGESFDEVAEAVIEALLSSPHDTMTVLTGADAPEITDLVDDVATRHPEVEVDVQAGGQPHYHLLIAAE
ncbi:MAG: DAK2 domain-containing protein [Gaiellaceae bacterium]